VKHKFAREQNKSFKLALTFVHVVSGSTQILYWNHLPWRSWDFIYSEYVTLAGKHHQSIVWQVCGSFRLHSVHKITSLMLRRLPVIFKRCLACPTKREPSSFITSSMPCLHNGICGASRCIKPRCYLGYGAKSDKRIIVSLHSLAWNTFMHFRPIYWLTWLHCELRIYTNALNYLFCRLLKTIQMRSS